MLRLVVDVRDQERPHHRDTDRRGGETDGGDDGGAAPPEIPPAGGASPRAATRAVPLTASAVKPPAASKPAMQTARRVPSAPIMGPPAMRVIVASNSPTTYALSPATTPTPRCPRR